MLVPDSLEPAESKLTKPLPSTEIQGDVLWVYPFEGESFKKIYLTESKSAWITVEWLSEELIDYATTNYQELFELHPAERGKVMVLFKEVDSPRWHRSYLRTPERDNSVMMSYMYSGKTPYKDTTLPIQFQPFLDYINEQEEGDNYNQVIANWYANGKDYTPAHSDCQVGMKPNTGIAIASLCEEEWSPRELRFTPKKLKGIPNDNLFRHVKVEMKHGSIITMYGDTQKKFRHSIIKNQAIKASRISLTFRKF